MARKRKEYGINPNASQWLKSHMGDRFKACQAIALLGCSKSMFFADRAANLITPQLNAADKPYYTGSQLLEYISLKQ